MSKKLRKYPCGDDAKGNVSVVKRRGNKTADGLTAW